MRTTESSSMTPAKRIQDLWLLDWKMVVCVKIPCAIRQVLISKMRNSRFHHHIEREREHLNRFFSGMPFYHSGGATSSPVALHCGVAVSYTHLTLPTN
eukprot:3694222-Ditylum_brightwellii.AAC.1